MPAEWEHHEATWIGWPHNRTDWPGKIVPIHWVYAEIARKLAPGELVRILVDSTAHEARTRRFLERAGVDLTRVQFFRFPTNRGWTRDFGPIFVRRPEVRGQRSEVSRRTPGSRHSSLDLPNKPIGTSDSGPQLSDSNCFETAIVRFGFNGWAKYRDWKKDDVIPDRVARKLGIRIFLAKARERRVVVEGGSIDVNGNGSLLTTEECLLDKRVQARNPGMTRLEMEAVFSDYLGATNVLWLGRGIAGDDTHGHIDDICRFVSPGTVVACLEKNPHDDNYRPLLENRERLEGMRLEDGSRIEVVDLPMPAPLYFDGRRLPASYANFYIANDAVLVPTFNDSNDRIALGTLAELNPHRPVVGIHAVDLVWGLGTIHCLTQQQPADGAPA
ncbi:MAG: agmatine deiminase family protein [Acidobacteria bacterium]|nr:agmatine deiminase family protein [Acidobacteriota bacterium]